MLFIEDPEGPSLLPATNKHNIPIDYIDLVCAKSPPWPTIGLECIIPFRFHSFSETTTVNGSPQMKLHGPANHEVSPAVH